MLNRSQPLSSKVVKKLKLDKGDCSADSKILYEYVGNMFDFLDDGENKITLSDRIEWLCKDIKGAYRDLLRIIHNHKRWRKVISGLRDWDGHGGMVKVMQTHLIHYIAYEEKHGHSTHEYRRHKINTAKATLRLLRRISNPDGYTRRRVAKIEAKYPKYKKLITRYSNGSVGTSGDFVAFGSGWIGREHGKDPREGYFELINGRFMLVKNRHQAEVAKILSEIESYYKELTNAYRLAETDAKMDFVRLHRLLKENLYTWWD